MRSLVQLQTPIDEHVFLGSPFTCKIINSVHVTASGVGIERVAVRRPTSFHIVVEDGDGADETPVVAIAGL